MNTTDDGTPDGETPKRRPGRPRGFTKEEVLAAADRIRAEGRALNPESLWKEMGKKGGRNALWNTLKEAERERDVDTAVAQTVVAILSAGGRAALEAGTQSLLRLLEKTIAAVEGSRHESALGVRFA